MHIYALTDKGHHLAQKIQSHWQKPVELFFKPNNFKQSVQESFQEKVPLVLICATGIAVRTLAPVLVDKYQDPPVLVLDENGRFIIPLLSGHQGGANDLACRLATVISATPVLTTANAYTHPLYTLGVGCERNCPLSELESIIDQALLRSALSIDDITAISSIDIKADETAIIQYAKNHQLAFETYSADTLKTVESQLSQRSDYIFKTVGVYGVAESAALYSAQSASGNNAELLLNKIKNTKATCAIARSYPINHKKITA